MSKARLSSYRPASPSTPTSLTLEQLTSRRRTIVGNMTEQMEVLARSKLKQGGEWDAVRKIEGGMDAATRFIESFRTAAAHEAEYYNDDRRLGNAVLDAVALSAIVEAWPRGLQALLDREKNCLLYTSPSPRD